MTNPQPDRPLVVVVDDLRSFPPLEERSRVVYARDSAEGVSVLESLHAAGEHVDELWLDHDLGIVGGSLDDVRPVVDWILERCVWDDPPSLGRIFVHTSNSQGASMMLRAFERYYPVRQVDALLSGCTITDPPAT